jgi:hypothetical protein
MCLQSAETVSEGGLDRGRRPRLKDGVGQPRVARAVRGVEVGRAAQEGEVQRVAHVGVGHREGRVLRQALHGGQVAGHMRARLRAHTCCIAPRTDVRSPQGQRSQRVGLKSASAIPAGLLAYQNSHSASSTAAHSVNSWMYNVNTTGAHVMRHPEAKQKGPAAAATNTTLATWCRTWHFMPSYSTTATSNHAAHLEADPLEQHQRLALPLLEELLQGGVALLPCKAEFAGTCQCTALTYHAAAQQ